MTFAKQQKYKPFINTKALRTRQIQGKHKDKTFAIQPLKNQGGCSGGTKEPQLAGWQGLTVESDNAHADGDEYDNCVHCFYNFGDAGKVSPWKVMMLMLMLMMMTTLFI